MDLGLKRRVEAALRRACGDDAVIALEETPEDRIGGKVVSVKFDGMRPHQRQELIWDEFDAALNQQERNRISFIITDAPPADEAELVARRRVAMADHPFVRSLVALVKRDDRAVLAELRRSLQQPLAAMPYVAPFLHDDDRREENAFILVAGLFALHPVHGTKSLATQLARVAEKSDSVALRFRALLDSEPEDLGVHLRHAVSLARANELPIDYDDLLGAVRWWGHETKWKQRAWARDFFTPRHADEDEQEEAAS